MLQLRPIYQQPDMIVAPPAMNDPALLQHTLQLAERRRGFCAPNPAVGAVIARAGSIIAEGVHQGCGQPHAEVAALAACAADAARGATLYVSLEPCAHYGRTPPCVAAIIAAGLQRVVYAERDPNPKVDGAGHAALEAAGITVEHRPLAEARAFYQSYRHWQQTQRPYVTSKLALSLDGKIANAQSQPVAITGPEAQQFTHQQRLRSDALLTTAHTVLCDDPQLTVRLQDAVVTKPVYILDRDLRTPLGAKIFETGASVTILHSKRVSEADCQPYVAQGAQCIAVEDAEQGLDLKKVVRRLGDLGIHDLWVEAGGRLTQALWQANLIDTGYFYIAATLLGSQALSAFSGPAWSFSGYQPHWQALGLDVVCKLIRQEAACLPA